MIIVIWAEFGPSFQCSWLLPTLHLGITPGFAVLGMELNQLCENRCNNNCTIFLTQKYYVFTKDQH